MRSQNGLVAGLWFIGLILAVFFRAIPLSMVSCSNAIARATSSPSAPQPCVSIMHYFISVEEFDLPRTAAHLVSTLFGYSDVSCTAPPSTGPFYKYVHHCMCYNSNILTSSTFKCEASV